jgi:hypothetical protein
MFESMLVGLSPQNCELKRMNGKQNGPMKPAVH